MDIVRNSEFDQDVIEDIFSKLNTDIRNMEEDLDTSTTKAINRIKRKLGRDKLSPLSIDKQIPSDTKKAVPSKEVQETSNVEKHDLPVENVGDERPKVASHDWSMEYPNVPPGYPQGGMVYGNVPPAYAQNPMPHPMYSPGQAYPYHPHQPMPGAHQGPYYPGGYGHREGYYHDNFYEDEKPKSKIKSIIFGTLFYSFLIFVVAVVYFFSSSNDEAPRTVLGITVMHVLTGSMQDVIPQGSVIVTKKVDPETLKIDDDITYLLESNRTVTHRIIGIQENYAEGERGFETKGTANPSPDKEIVLAKNVVGKVIFHNHTLGKVVLFIRDHIIWVGLLLVLSIAFIAVIRKLMKNKDNVHDDVHEYDRNRG